MHTRIRLYNYLAAGELIKEGDEAFTLNEFMENPTTVWIRIEKNGFGGDLIGTPYNRNMVKIRRRRERKASLRR